MTRHDMVNIDMNGSPRRQINRFRATVIAFILGKVETIGTLFYVHPKTGSSRLTSTSPNAKAGSDAGRSARAV